MANQQVSGNIIGKELNEARLGDVIHQIGLSISEAQFALDRNSLRIAEIMSGNYYEDDGTGTQVKKEFKIMFGGAEYSMLELGFTPTFYQFVDTVIEVKTSMSMSTDQKDFGLSVDTKVDAKVKGSMGFLSAKASTSIKASMVSAGYANRYQYSAEGSCIVRTKIVPLPAPAILEERLRKLLEQ